MTANPLMHTSFAQRNSHDKTWENVVQTKSYAIITFNSNQILGPETKRVSKEKSPVCFNHAGRIKDFAAWKIEKIDAPLIHQIPILLI